MQSCRSCHVERNLHNYANTLHLSHDPNNHIIGLEPKDFGGNPASSKGYINPHLGTIQADDSIYIPGAVEEVGDRDSVFTGRYPVLLGARVDLEDVGPRAEDGLLSVWRETRRRKDVKDVKDAHL